MSENSTPWIVIAIVVSVVLLVFVGTLLGGFWSYFDRSLELPGEIAGKVMTADEAIANYEWFKSQEAYIRQCLTDEEITKRQYDEYFVKLPENMVDWTDFMSKEEAGLRAAYNAHEKLTNKAIEDYNAKASMVHKSVFKELPTNIARSMEDAFVLILGDQ